MNITAPKRPTKTVYEDLRPLLFAIAYRMVASASEAEDIVQEAFLRFHRESSKEADIESPKAWLSTVTTRLAINHVQSARVRRESYFGTWLPEPLLTESEGARQAETADSLSLGRAEAAALHAVAHRRAARAKRGPHHPAPCPRLALGRT